MRFRKFHTHQTGETDCGPACVRTILRRHGVAVDTALLRESVGLGNRGASMLRLSQVLSGYGLDSELLRLDVSQLRTALDVAGPAIIRVHIDSRPHFIVVHAADEGRFTVSDPLFSRPSRMSADDLAEVFTGDTLITPRPARRPGVRVRVAGSGTQQVVWPLVRASWPVLLAILGLTAVAAAVTVVVGIFMQVAIDRVVPGGSPGPVDTLAALTGGAILAAAGANYLRGRMSVTLAQSMQRRLSLHFTRKLLGLPSSFHQGRRTGDLVSRLDDIQQIQTVAASTTVYAAVDTGVIIGVGAYLLQGNTYVALALTASLVGSVLISLWHYPQIRALAEEALQRDATLKAEFTNTLQHHEQIAALEARGFTEQRVNERLARRIAAEQRLGFLGTRHSAIKTANLGLTTVFVMWLSLRQAMAGVVSLGEVFSSVALAGYFLAAVDALTTLQITLQRLQAALGRYRDVMNQKGAMNPNPDRIPCSVSAPNSAPARTDIVVKELCVTYPGAARPALDGFTLTAEQGSSVLLTGPNGSGKSTALRTMAGLLAPTGGSIQVGSTMAVQMGGRTPDRQILYLSEVPFLVAADVRENLTLGVAGTDTDIARACRLACFDEVLETLPGRLSWLVSEDGTGMSRGQAQRLALARAILRNPDVYLLDEAFSGIDHTTVHRIWANFAALPATKIVVSHTSAVDLAFDQIVALDARPSLQPAPTAPTREL
ncbi:MULTISPECIES: ABC transporter transmembrane domain-containing protein [unclassified Streptomyces]|uniref:peptidase domain-containing ABC transporter n=1 Tax=unclassified Streptomyces TaxID=2593676 RepID=UPI000DC7A7F7|nr:MULTISPECIES: ABC transporter transmembrane domain-containing protein [unclassified Streptomyces]AWZ07985.1 hypothetical protein DRB89_29075 [Streptomyces sp. ICC4]AWZ15728.1 hypothetical protein DRB96_29645 [Streptomyces sp. ICC1]